MSSLGPVSLWIHQLKQGEQDNLQALWEAYLPRIVALARSKLFGASRTVSDEDDVAASVLKSVYFGIEEGRFPRLEDRNDLWQILVMITLRKVRNLVKHENRHKRSRARTQHLSTMPGTDDSGAAHFREMIDGEPDPALATQMADDLRALFEKLPDETMRNLARWKMEQCSNAEIAEKLGRSVKTVERKLQIIRGLWEKELA